MNNMQAVILCAGQSSRFYPLNSFIHKANTQLLGKPIYQHTLESVKRAGITDVIVVIGKNNFMRDKIGNGEVLGLKITYITQNEPKGMGEALLRAKDFLNHSFFVLHAHHIDFDVHKEALLNKQTTDEVILLAKEEDDVSHFGVLRVENDRVSEIIEKPQKGSEPSKLRLIGLYLLNQHFLTELQKTSVDHYSFEDALSKYADSNKVLFIKTDQPVITLKYPWSLLDINEALLESMDTYISPNAEVSKRALLKGKVIVEDGVVIKDGVVVYGPAYIGKNSYIGNNAILRNHVTIDEGVIVGANMEIKNSILFYKTTTHAGYIGDSVIGPENKIATYFITANVRLDRDTIKVTTVKGEVDTMKNHFGIVTGEKVKTGVRVTMMPGVIVGSNALIGPGTVVSKNIPDNTKFYTKFQEIIESRNGKKEPTPALRNNKKVVLIDIDYTLFNTAVFKESDLEKYEVYEEAIDMLVALGEKVVLGIFSEGELDFQMTKLQRTDIYKHFLEENIHIVASKDEKLGEILHIYKNSQIIIVDDKLTVLHAAKLLLPSIKTIWVKRGIYAENQKDISGFAADIILNDLKKIPEIIESMSERSEV